MAHILWKVLRVGWNGLQALELVLTLILPGLFCPPRRGTRLDVSVQ